MDVGARVDDVEDVRLHLEGPKAAEPGFGRRLGGAIGLHRGPCSVLLAHRAPWAAVRLRLLWWRHRRCRDGECDPAALPE